jgi:hypothetical protein
MRRRGTAPCAGAYAWDQPDDRISGRAHSQQIQQSAALSKVRLFAARFPGPYVRPFCLWILSGRASPSGQHRHLLDYVDCEKFSYS